jgi:glutathione S-transferase
MTSTITYTWTAWATLAALVMYCWVTAYAGQTRRKYKVESPLMEGPIEFLSAQRVQGNTVEHLVLFLPALWLCAVFYSDHIAAIVGAVWVAGRILYAVSYYRDPKKRGPGFLISTFATFGLMLLAASRLINP